MKRIAIEEHYFTEGFINYLRSRKDYPRMETREDEKHAKTEYMVRSQYKAVPFPADHIARLTDIGAGRIADMDRDGIDIQVLSASGPSVDELDVESGNTLAKEINDDTAKAIEKNPKRLAAFAAINHVDPKGAAAELERAVKELGFVGGKINSHARGEYTDDKKFWPFWEKAAELDVPVYIHPKEPPQDMIKPFTTYPVLAMAVWGFGADTSLHAMRLICSGLFDAYPKLQIILGHLGESIPWWLWRIDNHWNDDPISKKLKKKAGEYFKSNFYVTTSGMFTEPSFLCDYLVLGAERIIFAVDYPYEPSERAVKFMDNVPISDTDKEKIYHLNAERLLKLKV